MQLFVRGDDGRKVNLHVPADVTLGSLREKISRALALQRGGDEPLRLKAATGDANTFAELSGANDARAFADLGLQERSSVLVEGCAKFGTPKAFDAVTKLNALYDKYDAKKDARHHLVKFLTSLRDVLQRLCLNPDSMRVRQIDPATAEILEEVDTRPLLADIGFIHKEDRLLLPSGVSLHPARSVLTRIFERSPQLVTEALGTEVAPKAPFGKATAVGAGETNAAGSADTQSAFTQAASEAEQKAPAEFSLKARCEDGRVETFALPSSAVLGDLCEKLEEVFVFHQKDVQNRMKLRLVKPGSEAGKDEYVTMSPVDDWGTSLLDLGFTLPRSLVFLTNAAELGSKKAYTAVKIAEILFRSGDKNYGPQFSSMVVMLHRILYNLLKHPVKEKFRRIKESILRRVFKPVDGAMKLVHELGFTAQDDHFVFLPDASLIPPKLVLERLHTHFPDLEHSLSDVDELKEEKEKPPTPPKKTYNLGTLKKRRGIVSPEDEEAAAATQNFMSRPSPEFYSGGADADADAEEAPVRPYDTSLRGRLVAGGDALLNLLVPLVVVFFCCLYFYGLIFVFSTS